MDVPKLVWESRRRAGLTQRQLAERSGVAQPMIARIERGRSMPRVDTLERLLEACGFHLTIDQPLGYGIDRTQIAELLKLPPAERLVEAERDARWLYELDRIVARSKRV